MKTGVEIIAEDNEFEKYPELSEFIQEMASTGYAPQNWSGFIEVLNNALIAAEIDRLNDMKQNK